MDVHLSERKRPDPLDAADSEFDPIFSILQVPHRLINAIRTQRKQEIAI
jgi:hypothetical protein